MGCQKSASVLLLFMVWLSITTASPNNDDGLMPNPEETNNQLVKSNSDHPKLVPTSNTPDNLEYETALRRATERYKKTKEHGAKELIDWIKKERVTLAKSKQICKVIKCYTSLEKFWAKMARYVMYEYAIFGKERAVSLSPKTKSFAWLVSQVSPKDIQDFENIRELIDKMYKGQRETSLAKIMLNFKNSEPLTNHVTKLFRRTILIAFLHDIKKGVFRDKTKFTDVARALVRIYQIEKPRPSLMNRLIRYPPVGKLLPTHHLKLFYDEYRRVGTMNYERKAPVYYVEDVSQKSPNDVPALEAPKVKSHCKNYSPRRRRRSATNCLIGDEDYREIVTEKETPTGMVEVLNTEKFIELLDRVTERDSAAKRQQLLELGAALLKNPKVLLEGNAVMEFKDAVEFLEEDGPLEDGPGESLDPSPELSSRRTSHAIQPIPNPDHLMEDEFSWWFPLGRITSADSRPPPIRIADFGMARSFRLPMPDVRPVPMPEIIHPIEMAPARVALPEISLPTGQSRLALLPRRG